MASPVPQEPVSTGLKKWLKQIPVPKGAVTLWRPQYPQEVVKRGHLRRGFQGPTRRCSPRKPQKGAGSPRPTLGAGAWEGRGSFPASIPLPRRASRKRGGFSSTHTLQARVTGFLKPSSSPCASASTGAPRSRHCRHWLHKGPAKMDTATVAQKGRHGAEGGAVDRTLDRRGGMP